MQVRDYYKDKVILLSGCTGFLGKVVLEKFLRSIPHIKKIFVLVRPKSGVTVMERLKREILESQCFDNVKKEHPDFLSFVETKIEPIEGDIALDGIIFNQEKLQEIKDTVHLIINNAASIDFNLRLDQALQINFFGPLRLLQLSKQCKHLEAMTHVSTCYVNADKQGYIDERIYQYPNHPDSTVDQLLKMPITTLVEKTQEIIHPWPNTYTFTKSLAERALQIHRGNIPLLILRPAIIIAANSEPYPGWVDAMTAASPLTLMFCMGLLNYVGGSKKIRSDLIPVDFVSNAIIICTANQARKDSLSIVHSASSHLNPQTWYSYMMTVLHYSKTHPFENTIKTPKLTLVTKKQQEWLNYLTNHVPGKITLKFAELTGKQELQKNATRFLKLNVRMSKMYQLFEPFFTTDWCYESKAIPQILSTLNQEEQLIFNCNPKIIDWNRCSQFNVYGMQKYMFRMDVSLPYLENNQILNRFSVRYFDDIKTIFSKGSKIKPIYLEQLFDKILWNGRVQSELRNQQKNFQGKNNAQVQKSSQEVYNVLKAQTKTYLKELGSSIDPNMVKPFYWFLHKQFRKIFDQIIINDQELKSLKLLVEKKKQSVILVPSFKSYADFVLLTYIHLIYGIDLPFVTGLKEFEEITFITTLLRKAGGYFIDKSQLNNPLFKVILEEYLAEIMKKKYVLEYHIERQREKSGKLTKPQDFIMEYFVEAFLRNQTDIKDVVLVPITLNYDKIYESQQFPFELLGESTEQESLVKLLRSVAWVTEKYGRVCIKYCKPISLKGMIQKYTDNQGIPMHVFHNSHQTSQGDSGIEIQSQQATHKQRFTQELQMEIVHTLSENHVIMSTPLVASLLLLKRQGGLNEEEMLKQTTWLYGEIQARGGLTSLSVQPSITTVRSALHYLQPYVDRKQDIFEPQVKAKKDYKNILMLAYYRNNLVHVFLNEAYIACALIAFGQTVTDLEGVPMKRLWDQTEFLVQMLRDEFMVRNQFSSYEEFLKCLSLMQKRGYVQIEESANKIVKTTKEGEFAIRYLSSLVLPFVESYWVTLSFLTNLDQSLSHIPGMMEQKVQWLAETLYDESFVIYYESCSLESISNSIKKFLELGLLTSQSSVNPIDLKTEKVYIVSHQKEENERLTSLYERLTFFKPVVTFSNGMIKHSDDVRRIMRASLNQTSKL